MKSALQRLTEWYLQQFNGVWEHGYGFDIGTLDNPGVTVDIQLRGTYLESIPFAERKEAYDSRDRWIICRRTPERFEDRGAPSRLEDIVEDFLRWADHHRKPPFQSTEPPSPSPSESS